MAWSRPSVIGPAPSARCAHSTVMIVKIFIFGGWNGSRMLNDLHIFQPDTMTWSRPIFTGSAPCPRAGHTATQLDSKMLLFGGGDGSHYLNDLHILDTETMSWSQAYVAGTTPAARSRHTATLVGSKLYVFGGGDDTRVYNDMYVLDTETMAWSRPQVSGVMPSPRWGHTATLIGTKSPKILIFGGHDSKHMLNDLHLFDIETLSWSQPVISGNICSARAGHTATLVNNKLIVFGGGDGSRVLNDLYILDTLDTMTWSQPTISGTAPACRCAHTTTLIGSKLLVFGGGDGGRRFKDLYILDIELALQNEQDVRKNKKIIKKQDSKLSEDTKCKDITSWMNSNGFQKHTEVFIKEEIDMDTLIFINESDLEKLGVSHLGVRKKILQAINKLKQNEKENIINEEKLQVELKSLVVSVEKLSSSVEHMNKTLSYLSTCLANSTTNCGQFDFSSNDDKHKIKEQLHNK
jgi:N-acetylneuraminic acid mutarotase